MSTIRSIPFVNFQGKAREAMEFYRRVLGGTLELRAWDGKGAPRPAGPGDRIWQAQLEADGVRLVASDGHPDYPPRAGDNMAIVLRGPDRSRLATIFDGLAEGGQVLSPLAAQPWGGEVGWLRDRFQISWTVEIIGSQTGTRE